jgi:hypothetical protein
MRRDAGPLLHDTPADDPPAVGAPPEASRWAVGLFWASIAFAGFALLLLITSFFA